MVNYEGPALDATFSALADPTRRAIVARLALGESSVTELAAPFAVSLPAISKHLRVLEGAGLLAREKDGRVHRCRLVAEPLRDAAEWIARYRAFWESQLDALARHLNETAGQEESPWPPPSPRRRPSASNAPSPPPGKGSSGPGRTRKS